MQKTIRRLALGLASAITLTAAQAGFELTGAKGGTGPIELYAPAQRSSTFDGCKQLFPGGRPIPLTVVSADWMPRGLCSDSFAVLYSGKSKTPLVVVERLSRQQIEDADEKRTNTFFPDPRLPAAERAYLDDYKGSGYDRGHMAPAGDAPTPNAMAQTFSLSNIAPQDATHNRRVWSKLESDTRKYARRAQGDVYVFTGPLFDKGHTTIGRNRVWVPTRIFKLVYDQATGRAWAHVLPNTPDAQIGAPMDYASFVRATGWELLPGIELRGASGR